jgi:hypothetical protein
MVLRAHQQQHLGATLRQEKVVMNSERIERCHSWLWENDIPNLEMAVTKRFVVSKEVKRTTFKEEMEMVDSKVGS